MSSLTFRRETGLGPDMHMFHQSLSGNGSFCFPLRVRSHPTAIRCVERGCGACVSGARLSGKWIPSVWVFLLASAHTQAAVPQGPRCPRHLSSLLLPPLLRTAQNRDQESLRSLWLREGSNGTPSGTPHRYATPLRHVEILSFDHLVTGRYTVFRWRVGEQLSSLIV